MEGVVITEVLPVAVVHHEGEDKRQHSATTASLILRVPMLVLTKKAWKKNLSRS